jgi:hypothetical protein
MRAIVTGNCYGTLYQTISMNVGKIIKDALRSSAGSYSRKRPAGKFTSQTTGVKVWLASVEFTALG